MDWTFCRESLKDHFYQIILICNEQIQRRNFLKFGHFAPFLMPQQPQFSTEFKSLNNFERRRPKEHSYGLGEDDVIAKRIDAQWTDSDQKKKFCNFVILPLFLWRALKDHFYKIIMKYNKQIQRRGILKFGNFAPFLMPQQLNFSMVFKSLNNFERGRPKEHYCEVWLKWVLWFRRIWC